MKQPELGYKVTTDDFDDKRHACFIEDDSGNSAFVGYGRSRVAALKAAKRELARVLSVLDSEIKGAVG